MEKMDRKKPRKLSIMDDSSEGSEIKESKDLVSAVNEDCVRN